MLRILLFFVFCCIAGASEPPPAIVIFGVTGDLASKKIIPAIEALKKEGHLPEKFTLIGVGRRSEAEFRKKVSTDIHYTQANFHDDEGYEKLETLLKDSKGARIYFLSTPPSSFGPIVEKLNQHHLINEKSRVLIEKPFGHDLQSALLLQKTLSRHLDESQIYRIDHYLGKVGVLNLQELRASKKLESIWNHNHIEQVEITLSEQIGVGSRAQFWEETGLLRDIVQNHLMQLLAIVAMDLSQDISKAKTEALKSIRALDLPKVIRGQYERGCIKGAEVAAYKEELPNSTIETFVSATLFIDNERWQGVPFTLKAGKRLPEQLTEIVITFKSQKKLHIRVQPEPAIFFEKGESFSFEPSQHKEAYQKIIMSAIEGDKSAFVQNEEQIAAWRLLTPVLEYWKSNHRMVTYPAGSWPKIVPEG